MSGKLAATGETGKLNHNSIPADTTRIAARLIWNCFFGIRMFIHFLEILVFRILMALCVPLCNILGLVFFIYLLSWIL